MYGPHTFRVRGKWVMGLVSLADQKVCFRLDIESVFQHSLNLVNANTNLCPHCVENGRQLTDTKCLLECASKDPSERLK